MPELINESNSYIFDKLAQDYDARDKPSSSSHPQILVCVWLTV